VLLQQSKPTVSWTALGRALPAVQVRDPSPLFGPDEMHLQGWVQTWAPQCKRDISTLQWVQKNATKVIKGLKHLTYEKMLRAGTVQLRREKALGDLFSVYQCLTGRTKEIEIDFS